MTRYDGNRKLFKIYNILKTFNNNANKYMVKIREELVIIKKYHHK